MLVASIAGPSFEAAKEQIRQAEKHADALELRLDLFDFTDLESIEGLASLSSLPFIFTFRKNKKNALFRKKLLNKLALLAPAFIDLEWDDSDDLFLRFGKTSKIICSYHNFDETPDLSAVFRELLKRPADIYKIAAMARSSLDALNMLLFLKENQEKPLIGISMGSFGSVTRILGPVFGSFAVYAHVDGAPCSAPGQIDIETLAEVYGYKTLNRKTAIYGLIGNPVEQSISHRTHNRHMKRQGLESVYVKLQLMPEEIAKSLECMQILGIKGLSVTMPYKEEADRLMKNKSSLPINTISFTKTGLYGYNTDGEGACMALKRYTDLPGKKVLLLGSGSTAKAIAHALSKYGCNLHIFNRTENKAKTLAKEVSGTGYSLRLFSEIAKAGYDILINATSASMHEDEMPIFPGDFFTGACVMDVVSSPKKTKFLLEAEKRGCRIISGEEMFFCQAALQFSIWFGGVHEICC